MFQFSCVFKQRIFPEAWLGKSTDQRADSLQSEADVPFTRFAERRLPNARLLGDQGLSGVRKLRPVLLPVSAVWGAVEGDSLAARGGA